jgi:hypothetical protein
MFSSFVLVVFSIPDHPGASSNRFATIYDRDQKTRMALRIRPSIFPL